LIPESDIAEAGEADLRASLGKARCPSF
jgi:hypothetical protein